MHTAWPWRNSTAATGRPPPSQRSCSVAGIAPSEHGAIEVIMGSIRTETGGEDGMGWDAGRSGTHPALDVSLRVGGEAHVFTIRN